MDERRRMCAKSPVGAADVAFAPAVPLVGASVNAGEGGDIGDAGPGIGVDAGEGTTWRTGEAGKITCRSGCIRSQHTL